MITSVESFIGYYDSIRRRTVHYASALPDDRIDWSPKEDEFTCGEILRHLAATEWMFTGAVVEGRWRYSGHSGQPRESLMSLLARLQDGHLQAMASLRTMQDSDLLAPRPTLEGPTVKAWRLLMAMVEHEVHHRSQLAVYLSLMGIEPPQIYGLGVEDVIARATG